MAGRAREEFLDNLINRGFYRIYKRVKLFCLRCPLGKDTCRMSQLLIENPVINSSFEEVDPPFPVYRIENVMRGWKR